MAVGFYDLVDGALTRTHRLELDVDGTRTDVPELVGMDRPALILLNDDDLAYAKIRLDDDSLDDAIEHLSKIENPLARSLVWGSAWDSTRDAETAPRDYVRLVLGNIATETESTTVRTTLMQLLTVARMYVEPSARPGIIAEIGDALWALAQGAEAGSDSQFQFVKFFANVASTPAHVETLQGLRDGSITLPGVEIDTDLEWELLEGLALNGAASRSEIETALERDNTSNGQQAAARSAAALPSADDKRAAFDSLVARDELPNVVVRMTTMGYTHVNDPASLEGLVQPYFDALTEVWSSRTHAIAEYIVLGLYPAPLASQELVDATRAWLDANSDAAPALRRLVTENLAGVERALAAQARDRV
jgi:aminopeptidase N